MARPEYEAPSWYLAKSDPAIGSALRVLHNNSAHQWAVSELAEETGMSRAVLARRFAAVVGEPPMTFITNWRLTLATDLLLDPASPRTCLPVVAKLSKR